MHTSSQESDREKKKGTEPSPADQKMKKIRIGYTRGLPIAQARATSK